MSVTQGNREFFRELDNSFIDYHGEQDVGFLWHAEVALYLMLNVILTIYVPNFMCTIHAYKKPPTYSSFWKYQHQH